MYGQPLDPKRTSFAISDEDGVITLWVVDLDEEDNDDIRDINHPDFDNYWSNAMECVFELNDQDMINFLIRLNKNKAKTLKPPLKTMEEARNWCLSIGMVEDKELAGSVGG